MRYVLPAAALTVLSSFSSQTLANETNCPPGAWFCSSDVAIVDGSAPTIPPPPAAQTTQVVVEQDSSATPTPVVIVITPEDTRVVETPKAPECPPPRRVSPTKRSMPMFVNRANKKPQARAWQFEGGFDFYAQRMTFGSVFQGSGGQDEPHLVGGGGALRIHAVPKLEITLGNSALFGKDAHGFDRSEIGLLLGLRRHFNPTGMFRPYLMASGIIGGGGINSDKPSPLLPYRTQSGSYFAEYGALTGQAGVGLDWRFCTAMSIHVDLLLYSHWRFKATNDAPESIDSAGHASNTFSGGLIRTGLTFWSHSPKTH